MYASVAEAGFSSTWSHTLEDKFSHDMAHLCVSLLKTVEE